MGEADRQKILAEERSNNFNRFNPAPTRFNSIKIILLFVTIKPMQRKLIEKITFPLRRWTMTSMTREFPWEELPSFFLPHKYSIFHYSHTVAVTLIGVQFKIP